VIAASRSGSKTCQRGEPVRQRSSVHGTDQGIDVVISRQIARVLNRDMRHRSSVSFSRLPVDV